MRFHYFLPSLYLPPIKFRDVYLIDEIENDKDEMVIEDGKYTLYIYEIEKKMNKFISSFYFFVFV